jgi:hypothetical protein
VVVSGERAFIFYFTRQGGVDLDKSLSYSERHTVLQVAELHESDGALTVDRDATAHVYLRPPQEVASKRLKLRFRRPS